MTVRFRRVIPVEPQPPSWWLGSTSVAGASAPEPRPGGRNTRERLHRVRLGRSRAAVPVALDRESAMRPTSPASAPEHAEPGTQARLDLIGSVSESGRLATETGWQRRRVEMDGATSAGR